MKNIRQILIIRALEAAWFPVPTLILFYASCGLGIREALLLKAVNSLAMLLSEVPSGYFADLYGRKTSLIVGSSIISASLLLYLLGSSFEVFVLGEIVGGVGWSLISGTDIALAYDSLRSQAKEMQFPKIVGRMAAISALSESLCGLIGAFSANYSLRLPFALQLATTAGMVLISLRLEHVDHQSLDKHEVKGTIKESWIYLWRTVDLRWLIFLSGILGCSSFLIVWMAQEYMRQLSLSANEFGIAWAVFHVAMFAGSLCSHRLGSRFKAHKIFQCMTVGVAVSYFALASNLSPWLLLVICFVYFTRGLRGPVVSAYVNSRIPSGRRATILSLKSLVFRSLFVIIGPFIGWLNQWYSLQIALTSAGLLFLLVGGVLCWQFSLTHTQADNDQG